MDKLRFRVVTLMVSCTLLLSGTAREVVAWPCPPPAPPCHICTPTGWEYACGGSIERMFMYGNYIDEPIMIVVGGGKGLSESTG